ncbi:MAG: MauE/DoxX family redox-associated membrane protein, partial [Chloroflexota bacterium]
GKLRDMRAFVDTVRDFDLIPPQIGRRVAQAIVVLEGVVVISLLVGGWFHIVGFGLALVLLIMFCYALISVLRRKMAISCGCFGPNVKQVSRYDVIRNGVFVICAIIGLVVSPIALTPTLIETVLFIGMATAWVLIWTHLDEIMTVFRFEPPSRH